MTLRRVLSVLLLACLPAAAMERQANADYRARRQALATAVAKQGGSVIVMFAGIEAEGPNATYGFRQNDNFYYLTGWAEPGGAIMILPATGSRAYSEVFFLPARNPTQEKWTGPKLGPDSNDAASVTGFDRIAVMDKLRDELVAALPPNFAQVFADLANFDQTSTSSASIEWLRRSNAFPNYVSFIDVKPLLNNLRITKDAGEIELIRKASDASIPAHLAAMKAMKPGITEREISALMQYEFGKRGCERPAYAPIVGAGFNSTVLHYSADSATVREGDVIVMDVGGEYSMYATDITRTLPAHGKFTSRQREIYDIVLGAQRAAMAAFQAGVSTMSRSGEHSLYKVAYEYINSHGKDAHGQPLGPYFIHGLSHYVGLNVHDVGDSSLPLKPGAVFTIEPGIYIPEEKLGVRIEDIFYVDSNGKLVNFTEKLPQTADEVEQAMAAR